MSKPIKRIGILTGGGDCPGINAVIRAVVKTAIRDHKWECYGILDGFQGLIENRMRPLEWDSASNILTRGGTILGTSNKANPAKYAVGTDADGKPIFRDVREQAYAHYEDNGLDALIVIGGDGTMSCAAGMIEMGARCVGVPKTIDNDIEGTEVTFGFNTAVQSATEAIDRLHTTAESHDRVLVVEVMGRHVGHIATWAGLAGGAAITLVPEEPFEIDHVADLIAGRHRRGHWSSIVVVAEGAVPVEGTMPMPEIPVDVYGHQVLGGIGHRVAAEIERRTGIESRTTVLGHVQRGGTPVAFDRVLATRFGVAAVEAVADGALGQMVALQAGQITRVQVADAIGHLKMVEPELLRVSGVFQVPYDRG